MSCTKNRLLSEYIEYYQIDRCPSPKLDLPQPHNLAKPSICITLDVNGAKSLFTITTDFLVGTGVKFAWIRKRGQGDCHW
jgi:hypothetical protein